MCISFEKIQKFYSLYQKSCIGYYAEQIAKKTELVQHFKDQKTLKFKLKIDQSLCNLQGGMYGGALSTLLDYTTSFNLIIHDQQLRNSVSLNLQTYFVRPAIQDSEITIMSKTIQIGKGIGLAEFQTFNEQEKLLCSGSHQAYMKGPYKINEILAKEILKQFNQNNNIQR